MMDFDQRVIKVYPAPSGVPLNSDYTVKVREPGGVWKDLDEYNTKVGSPTKSNASFVYFDTDDQVEMSVTYNPGSITSTKIRGLNTTITPAISGNTMTFSLSGPMKLSLEVNDNVNRNLMIFANPLEVNPMETGERQIEMILSAFEKKYMTEIYELIKRTNHVLKVEVEAL